MHIGEIFCIPFFFFLLYYRIRREFEWSDRLVSASSWYEIKGGNVFDESDDKGLSETCDLLDELISHEMKEYNLPSSQVYIGGYEHGGMAASYYFMNTKMPLAGFIGFSTCLTRTSKIMDITEFANAKSPVLMVHGALDKNVPIGRARRSFELIVNLAEKFTRDLDDAELETYKEPQRIFHNIPNMGAVPEDYNDLIFVAEWIHEQSSRFECPTPKI